MLFAIVLAVMLRPRLWLVAVHQALLLAGPRWWRRPPYLPVPPPAYLRFRLVTAYGGDGTPPVRASGGRSPAEDVVAYLEWCRTMRAL